MNAKGKTEVFLLLHPPNKFIGSKLPSNQQALGVFLHLHNVENMTIRDAATDTVRQLQDIWLGKARIPVKPEQHSIKKLESLFKSWKDLKILRNRKTQAQTNKLNYFQESLEDLFDIAHD